MTFYGNVRYRILNGFSTINIQEQVYGINSDTQVPIIKTDYLHTFQVLGLEDKLFLKSYIKPYWVNYIYNGETKYTDSTGYVGIIEPIGSQSTVPNFGFINILELQHNTNNEYTLVGENINNYQYGNHYPPSSNSIVAGDYSIKTENITLISKIENNSDVCYQQYFYKKEIDGELQEVPLSFQMMSFNNLNCLDVKGHLSFYQDNNGVKEIIPPHFLNYTSIKKEIGNITYIPTLDTTVSPVKKYYKLEGIDNYVIVNSPSGNPSAQNYYEAIVPYENDFMVNALVGPYTSIQSKIEELQLLNTTLQKYPNGEPIIRNDSYITQLSNCADLYNNIGQFYNMLNLNSTNPQDVFNVNEFFEKISKDINDINELINGNILRVQAPNSVNNQIQCIYNHTIGHNPKNLLNYYIAEEDWIQTIISGTNYIKQFSYDNTLLTEVKSINYLPKYCIDQEKSSLFIKTIDDLRYLYLTSNIWENTVFKQKIEKLQDFFNLLSFVFFSKVSEEGIITDFITLQENKFNNLEPNEIWNSTDPLFIKWTKRMNNKYHIKSNA